MTDSAIPRDLDWVTERAACSVTAMFKKLEHGVQADVAKMAVIISEQGDKQTKLSFVAGRDRFSAVREGVVYPLPTSHSVDFSIEKGLIVAKWDAEKVLCEATIMLTNEGRCKLRVGKEELEDWQFRRMTLERLFFDTQRNYRAEFFGQQQ